MRRLASAALMLAAAWLAACTPGGASRRPDVDVPAAFRAQEDIGAERSIANLPWWEIYQDRSLQILLETALRENRDVRLAAARVEEARALAGASRLAQFPQIDAGVSATRARSLSLGTVRTGDIYGADVQVYYEADLWGRLARLNQAARADLLASSFSRDAVTASVVADVATAYFDLLSLDQQLRIAERTVGTRAKFLELTSARFERGIVSGLEVNRARANLAAARASLPDLRRRIAQTENQLQILLGRNPAPIFRPTLDLQALPQPPEVPAGLPSALLQRRPDLRQADAVVTAAGARLGAARASLFPTISLTGGLGSASTALSDLFSGPARTWSFGLALLQPIIDAARSGYQIDAAAAREQQAMLEYQQAVAQAFREVADALIARSRFAEFQAEQAAQVEALHRAADQVLSRYEIGWSSYFEVVDADRDLFNAELQLVQAYRNSLVALVQLYKALGGGWQPGQPGG